VQRTSPIRVPDDAHKPLDTKPCGRKELLKLSERIRTRVPVELKKRVDVVSCYEAGYDGFWLHCLLEAQGIRNYVIDPASAQVDRGTTLQQCMATLLSLGPRFRRQPLAPEGATLTGKGA